MFGTIRKHQTWLWFIIIGLMVLSMVTFNQMGRQGNRRTGGEFGAIDGRPVTQTEYQNANAEATLLYYLSTGDWPEPGTTRPGWNQEQEADKRIFLVRKLDQYNIHTDSDSVARLARDILREVGRGQNVPMDAFEAQVLKPHNLTAEDFERYLEHFLSIQQLASVVGASGKLVAPGEVQSLYVQQHQELRADAVFFSSSNYLASIPEPTPGLLAEFYTNSEAEYREPDQMQISYVRFNITNYLADAEKQLSPNLTNQVEDLYHRFGTNVTSLGATESEQRAKLRDMVVRNTALSNANVAAKSFWSVLAAKEPARADNLNALAKEKGVEVAVTKPFDKEYGPSDIELPPKFPVADFFNLTPDEPFVESPVPAADGVYIFAFNKLIPSRVPPLDEIRSRVIADWKYVEAVRMAQKSGSLFAETVTNGMARGEKFDAISAQAKMAPVALPAFSASTETLPQVESHMDLATFKQIAFSTPVGQTSGFVPTRGGGVIVYVREQLPIDQTKMNAELPDFAKTVRQERENEAFQLWFSKEASSALRDMPAFQRQRSS